MRTTTPRFISLYTSGLALLVTTLGSPAFAQNGLPFRVEAPPHSAYFGSSVLSGGDANADGFDDVLIMDSSYEENGHVLGRSIMYSGRTGGELWRVVGAQELSADRRYLTAAFVGDIDGDHCDDVILGQPNAAEQRGRVDVYSGRTGAVLYSFTGDQPEDRLGRSVAGVGHVDGDDIPDFAFVNRWTEHGTVSVCSGHNGEVIQMIERPWPRAVEGAGDLNGDHHADIAIGSWNTSGLGIGLYSGADGSVIHDLQRPQPDDETFGWALAGGHDLNGDHVPDLVASGNSQASPARAYFIDGHSGQATPILVPQHQQSSLFGFTVDLADVNGDGRFEAVLGDLWAVFVFDPTTGRALHWSPPLMTNQNVFGNEIAVGDVNGDGAADFITHDIIGTDGVTARAGAPILLHPDTNNYSRRTSHPLQIVAYRGEQGRHVFFLASRGVTSCAFIHQLDICINLSRPLARIGDALTDAEGFATLTIDPSHLTTGPVWFQAIDPGDAHRHAMSSNLLEMQFTE